MNTVNKTSRILGTVSAIVIMVIRRLLLSKCVKNANRLLSGTLLPRIRHKSHCHTTFKTAYKNRIEL